MSYSENKNRTQSMGTRYVPSKLNVLLLGTYGVGNDIFLVGDPLYFS